MMKNQNGITLVTVVVMLVVMSIIAAISITGGVSIARNAKKNVKEENLASVRNVVNKESAKINTSGVLTPANAKKYGIEDALINGQNIGTDWYYLDETVLREMGIEFADETYVVNYILNVVIPLSEEANLHEKIAGYKQN